MPDNKIVYCQRAAAFLLLINYVSSTMVPLYDLIFNQLPDDAANIESEDIRLLSLLSSQATFYTSVLSTHIVPKCLGQVPQNIPISLTAALLLFWRQVGDDQIGDAFGHYTLEFYQNYSFNFGIRWALTMSVIGLYNYLSIFIKSLSFNSWNITLTNLNEFLEKITTSLHLLLPLLPFIAWIYSCSPFIEEDTSFALDLLFSAWPCTEKANNLLRSMNNTDFLNLRLLQKSFHLELDSQFRGAALVKSFTSSTPPMISLQSELGNTTLTGSRMTSAYFFSANYLNAAVSESLWYFTAEFTSVLLVLCHFIRLDAVTQSAEKMGEWVKTKALDFKSFENKQWLPIMLTILGTLIFARVLYLPQEIFDGITQPTNTTLPEISTPCPLTPDMFALLGHVVTQMLQGSAFVFCDFFMRLGPWAVSDLLPESYPNAFIWCMLNGVVLWNAVAPLAMHFGIPLVIMWNGFQKREQIKNWVKGKFEQEGNQSLLLPQ